MTFLTPSKQRASSSLFKYKITEPIKFSQVAKFLEVVDRSEEILQDDLLDYLLWILTKQRFEGEVEQKAALLKLIYDKEINIGSDEEDGEQLDIMGNPITKKLNLDFAEETEGQTRVFDLMQDFDFIYSDFLREYQIDLYNTDITWRQFNALLSSLTDKAKISRVIEIRSWKPDRNTSANEIERMEKLKKHYKLI